MNHSKRLLPTCCAAAFLSAFLLFAIQPAMAKALLPGFGGSFVVWGACMTFFQALLIGGYAWAHWAQRRFGVLGYAKWHLLLLLAPLACAGVHYAAEPQPAAPLYLEVVRLLLLAVGAPFFALSTNSLILQSWFAASDHPRRDNPYVLYAVSNAGSMLALLGYPLVVEPALTLAMQWRVWWILYGVLIALIAMCLPRGSAAVAAPKAIEAPLIRPPWRQAALWLVLSMTGCAMLLAVTNMITFDVASIPLFWTLPLSVYLLSFVLLFKKNPWNPAWLDKLYDWAIVGAAVVFLLMQFGLTFLLVPQIVMQLAFLFVFCMKVHGRLAADKPADTRLLSSYFLTMSIGGFLGSFLVSWIVPLVFATLIEFPLALALAAAAATMQQVWRPEIEKHASERCRVWSTPAWVVAMALALTALPWVAGRAKLPSELVAGLCALPVAFSLLGARRRPMRLMLCLVCFAGFAPRVGSLAEGGRSLVQLRNFYGIYKVMDRDGVRWLMHGSTAHGRQRLDPARAAVPQSYYHPSTPAGNLMQTNPTHARDIAMIGLGTGALAAYLGPGQHFTVYELDPDNLKIAEENFTYLKIGREHGAKIDFVFGDGRINLRKAPAASYDLLLIDAFSSDAIPVHLLTVEAMREYFRTLRPDGIAVFHVSSKFILLEPLVASLARELGYAAASKTNSDSPAPDADPTHWTAVARNAKTLEPLVKGSHWRLVSTAKNAALPRAWTDQYSNLLGLLLWR